MMMKKWTALLCALMLLLAAMPALGEAASPYECLLAVYDRTGEGDNFLGMAVCCDGRVLTTAHADESFAAASKPYLAGAGYTLEISGVQSDGPIAVITPKMDEPLPSLTAAPCVAGEPVTLLALTPDGMTRTTGSALSPVTVDGATGYLTDSTGPAPLPLGTAVLSADGALVGLIGAMWGEGHSTYLVLPVADAPSAASPTTIQDDSLVNNKQPGGKQPADGNDAPTDDAAPASEATPDSDVASENWLSLLITTAHGHWITVDWSHCDLSKAGPDSQVVVYIEDADNLYYSWLADSAAVGAMEVPAVPGRFYTIGARLFDSMPEDDALRILGIPADTCVAVDMPDARPFNRYGYRDTELFLGVLPAGMSEDAAMLLQAEPIPATLDALRQEGKDVYLQATSKYRVKRDQECDMMITLTTPEDCVYHLEGTYLFMQDLSDGDVWNCNLQSLLDLYAEHNGGMSQGEYTVRYYFDGTLVNTLVFHAD